MARVSGGASPGWLGRRGRLRFSHGRFGVWAQHCRVVFPQWVCLCFCFLVRRVGFGLGLVPGLAVLPKKFPPCDKLAAEKKQKKPFLWEFRKKLFFGPQAYPMGGIFGGFVVAHCFRALVSGWAGVGLSGFDPNTRQKWGANPKNESTAKRSMGRNPPNRPTPERV